MTDRSLKDTNRLTGRAARYAKVGAAVGRVGARAMTGRVLGSRSDNAEMAVNLKNALGGLKGPLMKVAQLLATIPDVLPPEYATELAKLQVNAPAMGWPFVRRRMAGELGRRLAEEVHVLRSPGIGPPRHSARCTGRPRRTASSGPANSSTPTCSRRWRRT